MRVVLLFSPDPEEPDPGRGHAEGGQHYEFIPEDADVFVIWRERGEQFQGGYLDHTFAQGTFENISQRIVDRIRRALVSL